MTETRIRTNGAYLRIEDEGEGDPALIFLPYWGGTAETWRQTIRPLMARHRCVAVDLRGWGQSVVEDGRYDLEAMAADVTALIEALAIKRYVLVGHSMGGKVALMVAAGGPPGLAGLALVAPAPPEPMAVPAEQRQAMLASYQFEAGVMSAIEILTAAPLPEAARALVIRDTLGGAAEAKRMWTDAGMVLDISSGTRSIRCPVELFVGDRDRVEPEAATRKAFGRILPHAVVRVLAGVGHLAPLEAPDRLAELLQAFVASRAAGP